MKNLVLGYLIGTAVTVVLYLISNKTDVLPYLKIVNDDYASVLSFIVSAFLALITTVYVLFTYFQVKASNKSVEISKTMIEQNEKVMKMNNIPVLEFKINNITGSDYFGRRRRQMGLNVEISNIGEGPALQVLVKVQHYKFIREHIFITNI